CPPWQGGAWAARPRTREARTEGVEPSACGLGPHCSPRSTSLASGRDRTRTGKGLRLARLPNGCHRARWLALPARVAAGGFEESQDSRSPPTIASQIAVRRMDRPGFPEVRAASVFASSSV